MKKVLTYYLKPYYLRMIIGFAIKFLATIMELFLPWILAFMIDNIIPLKEKSGIFIWGFVMLLCCVGAMGFNIKANQMATRVSRDTTKAIRHEVIKDNQQAVMSWESGTIDNISLTGDLVSLYQNDEAYMSKQASMLWYIAVNEEVAGLDNADLRLALALCYDKQAICDNILKNGSIPANFCIPENFAIDQNGQYFRDAAGATYLETNKELALEHYNKACEELGTNSFTFELLYDDATTYLDMWTTGNNYNYGSYHNEEYDELVNAVSGELAADPDARVENMIKAEKIIMDEAGILPVYQVCNAYLVNPEYNVVFSSRGGFLWQYTTRK